jgi:hypothetical protein
MCWRSFGACARGDNLLERERDYTTGAALEREEQAARLQV